MSAESMTCAYCGRRLAYPDGFPDRAFAECWRCAWESHVRRDHPEIIRRVRRAVKKRAKKRAIREETAVLLDSERRLLLNPTDYAHHTTRGN